MRSLACAPETVRDHWPSGTSGGLLAPPKWSYGLSTLRWFLGLSALYLWSPVSAVAAVCLLCRWPWPPAYIFCLYKAMFHWTVTSLSLGACIRVWSMAHILLGFEGRRVAGCSRPASPVSCTASFSLPGLARCAWADLPAYCLKGKRSPFVFVITRASTECRYTESTSRC